VGRSTGGDASSGTPAAVAAAAVSDRQVDLERFAAPAKWKPTKTIRKAGRSYLGARWNSPWTAPGFDYTELIASWSARTPGSSWIEVEVRGRNAAGAKTSWDLMARWAAKDKVIKRRSGGAQGDDGTTVATDTWRTAGLSAYRIRVTTHREAGRKAPRVDLVTALTSRLPAGAPAVSTPSGAPAVELAVPRYSQMIHSGHYPQWGGGGEAWCSPTSTAMVLGHYGRLPGAGSYDWVPAGHPDPWVDATARSTFDHAYDGTGNWPFNTAYAARRLGAGGEAFVTRLRNLTEAESLVRAGIPPVVSIAFGKGALTGAPISASNGHLLVIVGFTEAGDVIANDPAAPSDDTVRRVYDRAQFERAWLTASAGTAYVIHDAAHPLPASSGNW
ncbi:MAG TPA: peptidase C39 family protein, partial [Acidimicrobiales bacterium]